MILSGKRKEAHAQFLLFCVVMEKGLREKAPAMVDLKVILGKANGKRIKNEVGACLLPEKKSPGLKPGQVVDASHALSSDMLRPG